MRWCAARLGEEKTLSMTDRPDSNCGSQRSENRRTMPSLHQPSAVGPGRKVTVKDSFFMRAMAGGSSFVVQSGMALLIELVHGAAPWCIAS